MNVPKWRNWMLKLNPPSFPGMSKTQMIRVTRLSFNQVLSAYSFIEL